ncbi:Hypothetical protein D9617_12g036460 [Elsinoe fawcettii]|nr:Hypothetical protein D9617_12g036460 [Elsinoe fawcettii]
MSGSQKSLTSFRAIGFDVMGTLLDEQVGIWKACEPLHQHLPSAQASRQVQEAFNDALSCLMKSSQPGTSYESLMVDAYSRVASSLSNGKHRPSKEESTAFANALADWPAWSDSVAALQALAVNSKLILVSNMDTTTLEKIVTVGGLKDVQFAALIGSDKSKAFKPDHRVNQTLLDTAKEQFGIKKEEVLLVAQGTGSDHVPAKDLGIESAWIDRYDQGQEVIDRLGIKPGWTFKSLQELVDQQKREQA